MWTAPVHRREQRNSWRAPALGARAANVGARVSKCPAHALGHMSFFSQAAALPSPNPKTVAGGVAALAVALITVVTVFNVVNWSASQTALVTAEATVVVAFLAAVVADLRPGTPREPVALAATFTALFSATLALGAGFHWWSLTEQQVSALAGVLTAVFGIGGALLARQKVIAKVSSAK